MSGAVLFTDLKPGLYALKVQAYSRNAVVPTVKRGFVIASDPNYCSLVLVDRGVTVTGNSALITTQLYGPATQLSCTLDGGDPFICKYLAYSHIGQAMQAYYSGFPSPFHFFILDYYFARCA